MTATERLRAMLDERGVEWSDGGYGNTATVWEANGILWRGLWRDGAIELVATMTPEQAIEATLGRGECHDMYEDDGYFKCSECGGRMHGWTEDDSAIWFSTPHFCPNCGRKVKS